MSPAAPLRDGHKGERASTTVHSPQEHFPQVPPPQRVQIPKLSLPQSALPRQQRLLSPNELSYHLPSRAYGVNDMALIIEFWAPPSSMTPSRVLLAWSIIRLRHPLIASRIVMTKPTPPPNSPRSVLENYYRSASYVLDTPQCPEEAISSSVQSLTMRHTGAYAQYKRSEDLVWEHNNNNRMLSSDELVQLLVYRCKSTHSDSESDSNTAIPAAAGIEKRQQYVIAIGAVHCVLDGISTFMLGDELFALLGGNATAATSEETRHCSTGAVPRTEAQLHALLRAEWVLRYGTASPLRNPLTSIYPKQQQPASSSSSSRSEPLAPSGTVSGFLPASAESRVPPPQNPYTAMKDFEKHQASFQGGHSFARRSPSQAQAAPVAQRGSRLDESHHTILETTVTPRLPNRHAIQRDIIWPAPLVKRILAKCRAQGVSVQNAMLAAASVAWLRMLERAKEEDRRKRNQEPVLMYTAVNLRPLVSEHAYEEAQRRVQEEKDRRGVKVPPSHAFLALGYFNVMLPAELPSSATSFLSSSRGEKGMLSPQAIIEKYFWDCARSAKKQASEAVRSPNLLSRTVLMGIERANRSVNFAMEDDGYVSRPKLAPSASTSGKPKQSPPPAQALIGFSLLGSIDTLYHYDTYPLITPTLCRTSTRKAYGGLLFFCYSFRGALYVVLGWDELGFSEEDEERRVGVRAFLSEVRKVVAEILVGDENASGVDVSGDRRLPEWVDSEATAEMYQPSAETMPRL